MKFYEPKHSYYILICIVGLLSAGTARMLTLLNCYSQMLHQNIPIIPIVLSLDEGIAKSNGYDKLVLNTSLMKLSFIYD